MSDASRLTARPAGDVPGAPPQGTSTLPGGALLHVPERAAAGAPAPLVVLFHGAGSTAAAGMRLLAGWSESAGLVLLAPQSRDATWDVIRGGFGPDVERLDEDLERVFASCPIAPGAVALGGFSDGASYALSLGLGNGDLVTDLIAFSPGFMAPEARRGRPRIFVTHGTADPVLPIDRCSRRLVGMLQRGGYDVTYEEFEGGHVVEPERAGRAVAWFTGARG